MLIFLSLLAGLNTYALTEADRDLIAAHLCFAELDRYSIRGREIIPRSKNNIRQIARSGHKTDDVHWTVNDYAVWDAENKKLQYVSIKTHLEPKDPAFEVKVLTAKTPPTVSTDKLVLAGGTDGYSCPISFDKKAGLNTVNAKLYQVSVAYEDCSDVHQAVELESELDEVTDDLVRIFEESAAWRLKVLTPKAIKGLVKKRGGKRRLKASYATAKKDIYRKCLPVQADNVQVGLRKFARSIKTSFSTKRLPAKK